jgi:hypothetical protein
MAKIKTLYKHMVKSIGPWMNVYIDNVNTFHMLSCVPSNTTAFEFTRVACYNS